MELSFLDAFFVPKFTFKNSENIACFYILHTKFNRNRELVFSTPKNTEHVVEMHPLKNVTNLAILKNMQKNS